MIPVMDLSPDLWQAILAASRQDWAVVESWECEVSGGRIDFLSGGHWHCSQRFKTDQTDALDLLAPVATAAGSFCIAQLGQSLDGRIATVSGDSHYINEPPARVHLHRLRALVDAVIIGAGTAIADRPQLTTRHVQGPNPARVILDPRGRVPQDGPLFEEVTDAPPTLHLVGPSHQSAPAHRSVQRIELALDGEGFDPTHLLKMLAERGYRRVLVEGGGITVSRFVDAGVLDRLHLLIAPLLIGSGRAGIRLDPVESLSNVQRRSMRAFECSGELIVDVAMR
jgi:diaminohydroxyphosphoribosylaminopyrimidine deaminase / 5-amino-6-(5-phosphoribosylamino)uracil reductase